MRTKRTPAQREKDAADKREKRARLRDLGLPIRSEYEKAMDAQRHRERRRGPRRRTDRDRERDRDKYARRVGWPVDPEDYSHPLSDVRIGP